MRTPKHLEQGQREEERVIRKVVGGANDEKAVEITSAPGWATARLCGHAAKTGWSPPADKAVLKLCTSASGFQYY